MKRPVFAADFWNKAIEQNKVGTVLTSKHIGDWKATLCIAGRHRVDLIFADNKNSLITLIYGDDDYIEIYFGNQKSDYINHIATKEQLLNFVANRSGSVELQNFFLFNQLF